MSADSSAGSIDPTNRGTWNRYSYVSNDPVNLNDPTGLIQCGDLPITGGGTVGSYLNADSDQGRLSRFVWAEGGTLSANGGSQSALATSDALIAQSVLNRVAIANGVIAVLGADGSIYSSNSELPGSLRAFILGYGSRGTTLSQEIVRAAAGTSEVNSNGELNDRSGLDTSLHIELGDPSRPVAGRVPVELANGSTYYVTPECDRSFLALQSTNAIVSGALSFNQEGFFVTSWKANGNSNPDPTRLYSFGSVGGTTFYGFGAYGYVPTRYRFR